MYCQEFFYRSEAYYHHLYLRDDILRRPLDLCVLNDDLSQEEDALFFGCFEDNGRLLGACLLLPRENAHFILKQMVVDRSRRDEHIGKNVITFAEKVLLERYAHPVISLEARHSAIGFYQKLGYHESGPRYIKDKVRLLHAPMTKNLRP